MQQTVVALLPMKAHSERVPRKNFRELAGKPAVLWILDTLLSLHEVSTVVINTDAREELARVGVTDSDRVMLRDRKESLRGDLVSMNLILADDVEAVSADTYLMTHTTNPLLGANTIRAALHRWKEVGETHDSLFGVNRVQERFYRADGTAINHDPDKLIRTQDLDPWFAENSCLYLFTRDSFRQTGARIGRRALQFATPALESVDIDGPEDWFLAEALLEKRLRDGCEMPGEIPQ